MVNIFRHQHGVASSKLKQNATVTWAKLWISGLHFLFASHILRIHEWEQNYAWITWKQLKVVLYTGWMIVVRIQTPRCWWIFATLWKMYAFKRHAVDESSPHCGKLTVDSFYILLGVYYSS